MKSIRSDQSGLTIVELVVTIVVGGILVLSSSIIVNNIIQTNNKARRLVVANATAENKAEELRSIGYVGLSNSTVNFDAEVQPLLGPTATGQYVIADEPVAAGGLKRVTITISFNDNGDTKTVNYESLIGELGVAQY